MILPTAAGAPRAPRLMRAEEEELLTASRRHLMSLMSLRLRAGSGHEDGLTRTLLADHAEENDKEDHGEDRGDNDARERASAEATSPAAGRRARAGIVAVRRLVLIVRRVPQAADLGARVGHVGEHLGVAALEGVLDGGEVDGGREGLRRVQVVV